MLRAIGSFVVMLLAPALFVISGWRSAANTKSSVMVPRWRRMFLTAGIVAASGAWLLLAAHEISMPYLRSVHGQSFVESFWRHSFPVGTSLSLIAVLLCLFGRGHARLYSVVGGLGVCSWWYFLGLLD